MNLAEAHADRRARGEALAQSEISAMVEELCRGVELDVKVPNYKLVGPAAKKKLSGLINHYRKSAKPFTQCVADNTKRFGAERAKKVCAVLTDLEKNTTKWRSGGKKTNASMLSEPLDTQPDIDDELFSLLSAIGQTDYRKILGLEAD